MGAVLCTVAVIAKEPVVGRAKTRLCPPCSPAEAARVAEAALADTLAELDRARVGRRVLVLDGSPGAWLPDGWEVVPQHDGGLDRRLAAAMCGLGGPVVVVGMDTPQVTAALLEGACELLVSDGVDAVLGPATDGGYWLIGLREPREDAVVGVPMSEPHTGSAQQERLVGLGLRVGRVPTLADVDTFDEALEVAAAVPGSRFAQAVGEVTRRLASPQGPAPGRSGGG